MDAACFYQTVEPSQLHDDITQKTKMVSTLKMMAVYSSETLVLTFQIIRYHIPEDYNQIYPDGADDTFSESLVPIRCHNPED
jgi:hypothetical protein